MGVLRIVGGALKGRRLRVPDLPGIRPTPDRVREALFNILGQHLDGERVLDAFAGTGALGFEALSRGAGSVVAVESDRRVARALSAAAGSLGLAAIVRVVVADACAWARAGEPSGPFDLVLADPPYAADAGPAFLEGLIRGGRLAPGARIALERSSASPPVPPPAGLERTRSAKYGSSSVDFFAATGDRGGGTA